MTSTRCVSLRRFLGDGVYLDIIRMRYKSGLLNSVIVSEKVFNTADATVMQSYPVYPANRDGDFYFFHRGRKLMLSDFCEISTMGII